MKYFIPFIIFLFSISCVDPLVDPNNASEFQDSLTFENTGYDSKSTRPGTIPTSDEDPDAVIRFKSLQHGPNLNLIPSFGDATQSYNVKPGDLVEIECEKVAPSLNAAKVWFQIENAGLYIELNYSPPVATFKVKFKITDKTASGTVKVIIGMESTNAKKSNQVTVLLNIVRDGDALPATQTFTTQTTVTSTLTSTSTSTTNTSTITTETTMTTLTSTVTSQTTITTMITIVTTGTTSTIITTTITTRTTTVTTVTSITTTNTTTTVYTGTTTSYCPPTVLYADTFGAYTSLADSANVQSSTSAIRTGTNNLLINLPDNNGDLNAEVRYQFSSNGATCYNGNNNSSISLWLRAFDSNSTTNSLSIALWDGFVYSSYQNIGTFPTTYTNVTRIINSFTGGFNRSCIKGIAIRGNITQWQTRQWYGDDFAFVDCYVAPTTSTTVFTGTTTTIEHWQNVGSPGFSGGSAFYVSFAFNPTSNEPYAAFADGGNDSKATVMRYNGSNWIYVGLAGFSVDAAVDISLAFNPSTNEPYIAFKDNGNGQRVTVMRFNGTSWVTVGTMGFSFAQAYYTSLAFNPSTNEPYVAFQDVGNEGKTTVMKFNGSIWSIVGSAGISPSQAWDQSIAFNPATNEPYVSFNDTFASIIMKFNGSNWINVGTPINNAISKTIDFQPISNDPYITFRDLSFGYRVTTSKFNGSMWQILGTNGFSAGDALWYSLAFNFLTNEPYVAYNDGGYSYKASVMKYNGSIWEYVGIPGFSLSSASYQQIEFHPISNEPYVAFRDDANSGKVTVMRFGY